MARASKIRLLTRLAGIAAGGLLLLGTPSYAAEPACPSRAGRSPQVSQPTAETTLLNLFTQDRLREEQLHPLAAIYRGDVTQDTALERIFTDALERDRLASAQRSLMEAGAVDACALSEDMRLSRILFMRDKSAEIDRLRPEVRVFEGVQPFNHFGGIDLELPSLVAPGGAFAYETPQDFAKALRLYRAYPVIIDNAIARFREGMAKRIVEPRLTVANLLLQLDALLDSPDAGAPFLAPIAALPASLAKGTRDAIAGEFRDATAHDVFPAYQRLRQFLQSEYLPAARESIGLSDLPGGNAYYRSLIARETTLPLDPDAVHALGLAEVARIEGEMDHVSHQLGNTGSLHDFFEAIRSDPRFHPHSAQDLQQRYEAVARIVDAQLPRFFAHVPSTPLLVEPYPAFRARFEAGGSYSEGGVQSGAPATFFYNTYDLKHRFVSGVTTLYLHEGMPGHHLQISLSRENTRLPAFQREADNNAFVEGWALYAETLGYDMGLYADPLQHWGTLDDEMLRAMRLVVDTGIHARHWSRQQAIDYMLTHSGMGRSDAETEVDRYIALPAQALSYKIGALEIQKLRREAETRLGSRFDIRAFHQEVIGSGALPLDVLQERVERWLAAQAGAPPARQAR
ncbi:DUF885 domain-containing protein [Novosphingobium profundi]|uniref:DUF885 domain-containing protein n=1 Tax=Novosphingobium profundi TaxID=1774954 RepID=UPI001BD9F685|nr:DUF885 domain-containing protein [Novosphingobium profundi]